MTMCYIKILCLLLVIIQLTISFNIKTNKKINNKKFISNHDTSMRLFGSALNAFTRGITYFDSDKESNRKFRRTIFTKHDWRKHRSGNRYFAELMSMPRSVVLRGLTMQALGVTCISSIIVIYNVLLELKILPKFLPLITAPPLPFTLTSSALGLLLVFRTNAAYSRWKDARIAWAVISAKSFDVMRQSAAWIENHDIASSIVRYISAYTRCLKWQLGHQGNDRRLADDLNGILTPNELEDLMHSRHRPQWMLFRVSSLLKKSGLAPNIQTHIDRSVCDISVSMTTCERIFTTPIPLMYTRHTARFLLLWLLTVPMCLYEEFSLTKKWMVPIISFLHAIFLFGIEELGVQIEEPFSILPLANICSDIQKSGEDMLYDAKIQWLPDEINSLDIEGYQLTDSITNQTYVFNSTITTTESFTNNNVTIDPNVNFQLTI
mmetsp:Transcript_21085/g.19208  ORF Transcript_21085/g.19208 Transcript_21085/m.19208 type:complete len:435 (+) Transcript_21085:15-1319(+)